MKALLQRVTEASVSIDGAQVAEINAGLLVFLGLDRGDNETSAQRMVDKMLAYRVFSDAQGRMNCSVQEVGAAVLLVSQFTLSADTRKGLRPGFSSALEPTAAETLYLQFLSMLQQRHSPVAAGVFGADMQVALVNDGPVTLLLEIDPV
jgi:D-tyrosyl-tRNA(Tyr) deacylase